MQIEHKKFLYVIETDTESRELCIEEDEVIENADGEIDIPLDFVLSKYKMNLEDLFKMKVATVSLVEEESSDRKLIRSISFEHLRLNK